MNSTMYMPAASEVKVHCWCLHGFLNDLVQASNLCLLNSNELEGISTNNLKNERDLSRFDQEAKFATSRKKRFGK